MAPSGALDWLIRASYQIIQHTVVAQKVSVFGRRGLLRRVGALARLALRTLRQHGCSAAVCAPYGLFVDSDGGRFGAFLAGRCLLTHLLVDDFDFLLSELVTAVRVSRLVEEGVSHGLLSC